MDNLQVYSWMGAVYFADHYNMVFFPSKDIYRKVRILPFQFYNLWNWHWEVYACEIQVVFCWVVTGTNRAFNS